MLANCLQFREDGLTTENQTLTYLRLKTKRNIKLDMMQNNRSKPLRCLTLRRGQELERAFRYSKESEIVKKIEIMNRKFQNKI